jgi:hypothetical protein
MSAAHPPGDPPDDAPVPNANPLDELIHGGPPETRAGVLVILAAYRAVLAEIEERYDDDPLDAMQQWIEAEMRFHAAFAPPGSPGPSKVTAALMEAVLQMQRGEPPSLLRFGPPRHPTRHPSPPHIVLVRALAAAVVSLLMAGGVRKRDAAGLVAGELKRIGIRSRTQDRNPAAWAKRWRDVATDPLGQDPIHVAYREWCACLLNVVAAAPATPGGRQAALLRALAEGVRRAGVTEI